MAEFKIRTDLAVELKDGVKCNRDIEGISIDEEYLENGSVKVTKVVVEDENGARYIGKPMGNYITLEARELGEADDSYHRNISKLLAKYLKERRPDLPTRVNTNGLSSLYNKRDITPEFEGLLDTVSISLNTSNKEDYLKLTRSQYGIDSFDELLDFAKKCKAYVPHVVLTIVDTTIPEKDVEICKQIAQNIGVTLRIRPFED